MSKDSKWGYFSLASFPDENSFNDKPFFIIKLDKTQLAKLSVLLDYQNQQFNYQFIQSSSLEALPNEIMIFNPPNWETQLINPHFQKKISKQIIKPEMSEFINSPLQEPEFDTFKEVLVKRLNTNGKYYRQFHQTVLVNQNFIKRGQNLKQITRIVSQR